MIKGVVVGVEELGFFGPMGCDIWGCRPLAEEMFFYGMCVAFIFSCCDLGINNGLYLLVNNGVVGIVVGGSYMTSYFVGWVWSSGEYKRLACWINFGEILCLVLNSLGG